MTSLRDLAQTTGKLFSDNSPAILTAIGVTGTITTAIFAHRAGIRATQLVEDEMSRRNFYNTRAGEKAMDDITPRENFELVWREYVPPVVAGVATVTAIIMANRIGTRRTAAMAVAYSITERAYTDYREKVVDTFGKTKETKVRDSIAQDRVNERPIGSQQIYVTGGGDVDFFDLYTGRYFKSDMETVKKAMNDINYSILNHDNASLTDFYEKLGLPGTKSSDSVGWNTDKLLDIVFSTTMTDNDRPCIAIDFRVAPIRDYFRNTH